MKHFIGGPTLWGRARRRTALVVSVFVAAAGFVAMQSIEQAGAGPTPSEGCANANLPSADGFNLGRTEFPAATTRSFQKNDTITITVSGPTDQGFAGSNVTISHVALNTVVDLNESSPTLPKTYTFTFAHSGGFYVRWAALTANSAVINATWDVSCIPTASPFSAACESARDGDGNRKYVSAGYPGDLPFAAGERLVVTSAPAPNEDSPVPIDTRISTENNGPSQPVAKGPGFTTVGYTIQAADVGKLVNWQIFGGVNAQWTVYCYPAAASSENIANITGRGIVKVNGVEVANQEFVNTLTTPSDDVPNAVTGATQQTRTSLLALGYEGPITCAPAVVTQATSQPSLFRNVGQTTYSANPQSDSYVNVFVTKHNVVCTQNALAACGENAPTPAGYKLVKGTEGNDVLTGGSGKTIIKGLGGNDRISDLSGDDIICGGPGNDNISGGGGNDLLLGGTGTDQIDGAGGTDSAYDPDAGTRYNSVEKILS